MFASYSFSYQITFPYLLTLFFSNILICIAQTKDLNQTQIDSIIRLNQFQNTQEAYEQSHIIRKWSEKHVYSNGIYQSNANLLWYHANKYQRDSFDVYIGKMDRFKIIKADSLLSVKYLHLKGLAMERFFKESFVAYQFFKDALQYLPKLNPNLDLEIHIKSGIASYYISKGQYDETIALLKPFLKYHDKMSNNSKQHCYGILAMAYQFTKQPEKSLPLHQQLIALSEDKHDLACYKTNITYDYYLQGEYQRAIDSALSIRPLVIEAFLGGLSTNSEFLATYYEALEEYHQAIFYIEEAIHHSKNNNELPEYYEKLAIYHEKLGNTHLAYQAHKKSKRILDSIRDIELQEYVAFTKKEITDITATTATNDDEQYYGMANTFALLFMITLCCIYLYRKRIPVGQKLIRENKKLKTEIKQKKDTLSTIRISQKEQTLQLANFKNRLLVASKNNDLQEIKKITNTINEIINSLSDCQNLSKNSEATDRNNFIYLLKQKHTTLSETDLKHCFFIYMGMSLKDTANILHVSTNTVKSGRRRAKSKISTSIMDGKTFKEYLESIEVTEPYISIENKNYDSENPITYKKAN